MDGFVGRRRELALLQALLAKATQGGRAGRPGRAVLLRGRRRVGKSRLVEEFLDRAQVPQLFFTASAQSSLHADLELFVQDVRASTLPGASAFEDQQPHSWDAALSLLAQTLPDDAPAVVVLDELPYLIANDPGFEGSLQRAFDRELSRRPVLVIGIGSDLGMMAMLDDYGRPFHQRATELVLPPLSPADVADLLELPPADAVDAYLVSGGLPLVLDEWAPGTGALDHLAAILDDPTSALLVSGERSLAAEFPPMAQARTVLSALGTGERTFTSIARAAGGIPHGSLQRALRPLISKGVVDAVTPLSTVASRETRYSVADPHLRFWLAFLGPHLPEIERGRGDLVLERIRRGWSSWRGRAVEGVVREALRRIPDQLPEGTAAVGGYWTRSNDVEVDLVGADRDGVAQRLTFVGSIKWQQERPFDVHDLAALIHHRSRVPGADDTTPLLAVSRAGGELDGVRVISPEQLVTAFR